MTLIRKKYWHFKHNLSLIEILAFQPYFCFWRWCNCAFSAKCRRSLMPLMSTLQLFQHFENAGETLEADAKQLSYSLAQRAFERFLTHGGSWQSRLETSINVDQSSASKLMTGLDVGINCGLGRDRISRILSTAISRCASVLEKSKLARKFSSR